MVSSLFGTIAIINNPLTDCWGDHRDENGNIVPDKDRFPESAKISMYFIIFSSLLSIQWTGSCHKVCQL